MLLLRWLRGCLGVHATLDVEALAHTLSQFHDVFDLIPDFLHDLLVGLMLLIDLIDRALLAQVLVALYNEEGDLGQPALGAEL